MLLSGRVSLQPGSGAQSVGATVDEISPLHYSALAAGHSGYVHIFWVFFLTVTYSRAETLSVWLIKTAHRSQFLAHCRVLPSRGTAWLGLLGTDSALSFQRKEGDLPTLSLHKNQEEKYLLQLPKCN